MDAFAVLTINLALVEMKGELSSGYYEKLFLLLAQQARSQQ